MSQDLKLLYLEDDQTQADALLAILQDSGYECTHCQNAETFLEILKTDEFDLLILDWELPDMSGIALLDALNKTIPFYLLTGDLSFSAAVDQNHRITGILYKPLDESEILRLIAEHCCSTVD